MTDLALDLRMNMSHKQIRNPDGLEKISSADKCQAAESEYLLKMYTAPSENGHLWTTPRKAPSEIHKDRSFN